MKDTVKRIFPLNIQFFAEPGDGGEPAPNPNPDDTGGGKGIMIPKHRFDEVSQRAQQSEAEIAELKAKLAEAEKAGARVSELEKKIEEIEKGYKDKEALVNKTNVIKKLVGDRVVDFEVFLSLLDLDKIEITKEGKTKGLQVQVSQLQKEKSYLFKPARKTVEAGAKGKGQPEKSFAQKLAEKKKKQMATTKSKTYFK